MLSNDTDIRYLTFRLSGDMFAIEVGKVHEILDHFEITRVPRMPKFLRGVINLRGNIIAIADISLKLGMSACELTADTCIVITETTVRGETVIVGILADSVHDVINPEPEHIFLPPKVGIRINPEFVSRICEQDELLLMILDTDRILAYHEELIVKS